MRIDPLTFFFACGALFMALPILVWVLLHRRHDPLLVNLWCLSGLLFGGVLVLYGLRGTAPGWLSVWVANFMGYVAASLQVAVLRVEGGRPAHARVLALVCGVGLVATVLAESDDTLLRQGVVNIVQATLALALTHAAWRLSQERHSRSARTMALLFAVMCLILFTRGGMYLGGWIVAPGFGADWLFLPAVLVTLFAAITGSVGFVGLALDRSRATAREQQAALMNIRDQQLAQDMAAQTRKVLAADRARTTKLLAHEVRQPLHNASVALQAALASLSRSQNLSEATQAVGQAQSVIRRVSATLDNTVAATTLLAGLERITTADADLQILIDLSVGDLPPEARARVHVDYRADARSARLEPTLVRLALRNLLANATLYAPEPTPVTLRVLDSDDPLALVIEVVDEGPGIPEDLRERIFDEGVRAAPATVPGYGLGLHVVQRVARLHGGSVEWRANEPAGSVFRLTLPQADPA